MMSLKRGQTLNDLIKRNETLKLNDFVLRFEAFTEMNGKKNIRMRRILKNPKILNKETCLSYFQKNNATNFKEYFKITYNLDTEDAHQPMVQVESYETNLNFILRNFAAKAKSPKCSDYQMKFIPEHLKVIQFSESYLNLFSMLPAIFHRVNSIKKAEELSIKIKSFIHKTLPNEMVKFFKITTW